MLVDREGANPRLKGQESYLIPTAKFLCIFRWSVQIFWCIDFSARCTFSDWKFSLEISYFPSEKARVVLDQLQRWWGPDCGRLTQDSKMWIKISLILQKSRSGELASISSHSLIFVRGGSLSRGDVRQELLDELSVRLEVVEPDVEGDVTPERQFSLQNLGVL